jgi:hypothetical protein
VSWAEAGKKIVSGRRSIIIDLSDVYCSTQNQCDEANNACVEVATGGKAKDYISLHPYFVEAKTYGAQIYRGDTITWVYFRTDPAVSEHAATLFRQRHAFILLLFDVATFWWWQCVRVASSNYLVSSLQIPGLRRTCSQLCPFTHVPIGKSQIKFENPTSLW